MHDKMTVVWPRENQMHHCALTSPGTNPQPVEKTVFFDGLADGAVGS